MWTTNHNNNYGAQNNRNFLPMGIAANAPSAPASHSSIGAMSKIYEELLTETVNDVIDSLALEVAFKMHRQIKTQLYAQHTIDVAIGADIFEDITYGALQDAATSHNGHASTNSSSTLHNYVAPSASSSSSNSNANGLAHSIRFACPNCTRPVIASRYAPHLEKCMGVSRTARNSSRIAAVRLSAYQSELAEPVTPNHHHRRKRRDMEEEREGEREGEGEGDDDDDDDGTFRLGDDEDGDDDSYVPRSSRTTTAAATDHDYYGGSDSMEEDETLERGTTDVAVAMQQRPHNGNKTLPANSHTIIHQSGNGHRTIQHGVADSVDSPQTTDAWKTVPLGKQTEEWGPNLKGSGQHQMFIHHPYQYPGHQQQPSLNQLEEEETPQHHSNNSNSNTTAEPEGDAQGGRGTAAKKKRASPRGAAVVTTATRGARGTGRGRGRGRGRGTTTTTSPATTATTSTTPTTTTPTTTVTMATKTVPASMAGKTLPIAFVPYSPHMSQSPTSPASPATTTTPPLVTTSTLATTSVTSQPRRGGRGAGGSNPTTAAGLVRKSVAAARGRGVKRKPTT